MTINKGFSNNVYGEIKHPFVRQIIKQTNLKSDQVFLDMVNDYY
jgi:hypothetical protein